MVSLGISCLPLPILLSKKASPKTQFRWIQLEGANMPARAQKSEVRKKYVEMFLSGGRKIMYICV